MNTENKKRTLLIGIPGFLNGDKMFGVTGNYMEFASRIDGGSNVRIIMPHEEKVDVDLLLLPGGMDLSPSSYKQVPSYQSGNHDVFKEFFFRHKLRAYIEGGTPIFGICLGFQMLNVALGGTLTQNIVGHAQSRERWAEAHPVKLHGYKLSLPKSKKDKEKEDEIKVNSHHHQAVTEDDLAAGLITVASCRTPIDGTIIEAFKHAELKIAGVQWHPEELYDPISDILINELLA